MERHFFGVRTHELTNQILWTELSTNADNKGKLSSLCKKQAEILTMLFNMRFSASAPDRDIYGATLVIVERAMIVLTAKLLSSPFIQPTKQIIDFARALSTYDLPPLPANNLQEREVGNVKLITPENGLVELTSVQLSIMHANPSLVIFQYVRPLCGALPRLVNREGKPTSIEQSAITDEFKWMVAKYNKLCEIGDFRHDSSFARAIALSYAAEIGTVMVNVRMENLMKKIRERLKGKILLTFNHEHIFSELATEINAIKADLAYVNEARATRNRVIKDRTERELVIDLAFMWNNDHISIDEFWLLVVPIINDYKQGRKGAAIKKRDFLLQNISGIFPKWRAANYPVQNPHFDIASVKHHAGQSVADQSNVPIEYIQICTPPIQEANRRSRERKVAFIISASPGLLFAILRRLSREINYRDDLIASIESRFPGFQGRNLLGIHGRINLVDELVKDAEGRLDHDSKLAFQSVFYSQLRLFSEYRSIDEELMKTYWRELVDRIRSYKDLPYNLGSGYARHGRAQAVEIKNEKLPNRQVCKFDTGQELPVWQVLRDLMLYQPGRPDVQSKPSQLHSLGITDNEIVQMLFNAYKRYSREIGRDPNYRLSEYLLSMFASFCTTLLDADTIYGREQVLRAIIGEVIKREDESKVQTS